MSSLKKPYEISVWQDYYEGSELKEKKVLVIGSNLMTSQNRAIEPKFVTNINGTHTLTFTLYFKYQDTETGEEVENQFIPYLANETKVKLKYDGKWYDFIVKNIVESSDKKAFSYTLSDLYINELSKTGFDITLATELENNVGSVIELAQTALEGTDWVVGTSETIVQENKEILFTFTTNTSITAIPLIKGNSGITPGASTTIPSGATIYGFYSCCSAREDRFQFIYMNGADIQVDSERVILNGQQYYIDNVQYSDNTAYSVGVPNFCNNNPILDNYRGAKFVFTQVSKRDRLLDRIVKKYTKNNETYWGYVDTQYVSPNIITDYVSNGSEIKTTSGWRAGILGNDATVKPDLDAVTFPSIPDLINSIPPQSLAGKTYTPYLKLGFKGSNGIIVNSGFTDSKKLVKDIALGEKFVCYLNTGVKNGSQLVTYRPKFIKVAAYDYDVQTAKYTLGTVYLTFNYLDFVQDGQTGNYYACATATAQISEAELKALNTKIGIFIEHDSTIDIYVKEFKLFRYYDKGDGTPILPSEQNVEAKVVNTYYYYKDYSQNPPTSADEIKYDKQDAPDSSYIPAYTTNCEKQKIVNVSQSNRFNIIHTLCESFECWASFEINHNENGAIVPFVEGEDYGKRIVFRNYVGQENPVDLRYGVNVKSIQRTLDSKQLTTKLIVKANSNQYAPNGMCTIARAAANPTGETTIFNFDYYVNQGLLDAGELEKDLYLESSPYMGYYVKLARINKEMRAISEKLVTLQTPLAKARAEVQEYEAGALGAEEKFETIDATLTKGYGIGYNGIINSSTTSDIYKRMKGDQAQGIPADEKLVNYVVEAAQYYQAAIDYNSKLEGARATLAQYEAQQQSLQSDLSDLAESKKTLNTNFFKKYSRFIQEGTWTSESYTDENLYFYDAQAVSYESSVPSVTYSISVIDVSPLDGYELYKYQLGDRTYIQDTEFFGYTEIDGVKTPAREGIVVTELTYNLDQPENNTFKVQTYKNQFQDLFQRVGATVQQLKLSTGAYNRAAALAEADVAHKVEFLQSALNDAATILMNSADQTVVWDNTGITVTNNLDRSQVLRLVSGGLLLSTDGGQSWQLGITAEGISANKITSGQVDTSLVQIMNGSEAYFRWDVYGITAYDFDNPLKPEYINGLNTSKGVRFDRFGIYGFEGIDGANWHPNCVADWDNTPGADPIRAHSLFELTWDGLYLNLGHAQYHHTTTGVTVDSQDINHNTKATIGKVDDFIFNAWGSDGIPYYNPDSAWVALHDAFVKVFAVGNGVGNETLVIYDDGTLTADKVKLTGSIEWTDASSPSKSVYASTNLTKPADGTRYNDFPASGSGWHKNVSSQDKYYCHTDNGGATWQGPIALTGAKGDPGDKTAVVYLYQRASSAPSAITSNNIQYTFSTQTMTNIPTGWSATIPSGDNPCYVVTAFAYGVGNTDTVTFAANDWTNPTVLVKDGEKGDPGSDGRGIQSVVDYYACNNSPTSAPTTGWSTNVPTLTSNNPYLWNYEVITYTDGDDDTTPEQMIGSLGADGKGIQSITDYYAVAASGDAPTDGDWGDSPPSVLTSDKPYLWNKEVITYTDGNSRTAISIIGARGGDGSPGAPGQSASIQDIYYRTNTSAYSSKPDSWVTESGSSSNTWTTYDLSADSSCQYVFTATQTANGNSAQCTDPVLYKAWTGTNNLPPQDNYATFLKTVNFNTNGLYFNNGVLAINASAILAGELVVRNNNNVVFSANVSSGEATIGGFTVDATKLYTSYNDGTTKYVGLQSNDGTNTTKLIFAGATANDGSGAVFYVRQDGYLYSTSGVIGGFTIEADKLYIQQGNKYTGLQTGATQAVKNFFAGASNSSGSNATFYVTQAGGMYSTLGQIGGWEISSEGLKWYTTTAGLGNCKTHINSDITKTFDSLIEKNKSVPKAIDIGGYPEWDATKSYSSGERVTWYGTYCQITSYWAFEWNNSEQSAAGTSPPNSYWKSLDPSLNTAFLVLQDGSVYLTAIKIGNGENSLYLLDYSYDNGFWLKSGVKHLEEPYYFSGIHTSTYPSSMSFSHTNLSYFSDKLTLYQSSKRYGVSSISGKGLWTSSDASASTTSQYGIFITDGDILFYGETDTQKNVISKTNTSNTSFARISSSYGNNPLVKLFGNWHTENTIVVDSDKAFKNSISALGFKYSNLFDNLIPVSYKLNKETSNRLHTGFIAQDVLSAIQKANLTAKDFAGYVEYTDKDGQKFSGLRYEEFISLNTWQIQLLKSRVSELEQKLFTLEEKLNALQNQ